MEIEPRVVMADGGSNPRDSVVAVATAGVSLVARTGYLVVDFTGFDVGFRAEGRRTQRGP